MTWIRVKNDVEPSTPPSGRTELYVDSASKKLFSKDDNGVITDYSATIDPYLSAGIYDIPTITEENGIITVGDNGTYNLFSNSDGSGVIQNHSIDGGDFTPTTGGLSYIVANYNSGNPIIEMITDVSLINETTIIPVVTIYCDGTRCHILDWDQLGKGLSNKIHQSIVKTDRYRRESGLTLSETGTRNIIITSGVVWVGANRQTPAQVNTTIDNIEFFYNVAGVWTSSIVNQYNNTQYDNGTNLVTLTNNRYAVNYIYRSVDNHKDVYMILGTGDYTLPEALSAQPRTPPSVIQNTAILVGRIIVLKSASTASQIDSAFVTHFTSSGIQNHNDLQGIQGGNTGEYYHLTSAQNTIVSNTSGINTGDENLFPTNITTNATYYPLFTSSTGSAVAPTHISTSLFKINPSNGTLIAGKFGIGVSIPTRTVHLNEGANTAVFVKFTNSSPTGNTVTDGTEIGIDASGNTELRNYEDKNLNIYTNNTQRMTILNNGKVGINIAAPNYDLDVYGTTRTDNLVMAKTSGYGIKIDPAAPTFGWRDLVADINTRDVSNPANPSYNVFRGGLRNFQFSLNDECYVMFHLPHDYVPGSDIYIHCHWAHASTTVTSGSVTWSFEVIYAKGHNQAAFSAPITTSVTQAASTTQYQHMIAEVQLSAASPSASQLNTSLIEVDGLLEARVYLSANTMNGTPEPFLKYVDIHYQSTGIPTKNKAPNFYT